MLLKAEQAVCCVTERTLPCRPTTCMHTDTPLFPKNMCLYEGQKHYISAVLENGSLKKSIS